MDVTQILIHKNGIVVAGSDKLEDAFKRFIWLYDRRTLKSTAFKTEMNCKLYLKPATPIIQLKVIPGYRGTLTVVVALEAFTTMSVYSVGSMDRINTIIESAEICSYGSCFGLTGFTASLKENKTSCLSYGFNHLRKLKF